MKTDKQIKKEIVKEFKYGKYEEETFHVEIKNWNKNSKIISIYRDGERPVIPSHYSLSKFFLTLENIFGYKYVYLYDNIRQTGCITCDYEGNKLYEGGFVSIPYVDFIGSKYGWEFLVSNKPIEDRILQ